MDKKTGYGIGTLILDGLLVIELIVDIVKGELTSISMLKGLMLILLVSIPVILWIRSRRKK